MYKEKLQEIISESFIQDKLDIKRFIDMSKKVEKISESKAKKLLSEMNPYTAVKVTAGVGVLVALLAKLTEFWLTLDERKKKFDTDWKKCRDKCVNIYGPKIKRARDIKAYGSDDDVKEYKDDFVECKERCDEIYYTKLAKIKKQKKEIKIKIKKAKEEIKRKKAQEATKKVHKK